MFNVHKKNLNRSTILFFNLFLLVINTEVLRLININNRNNISIKTLTNIYFINIKTKMPCF